MKGPCRTVHLEDALGDADRRTQRQQAAGLAVLRRRAQLAAAERTSLSFKAWRAHCGARVQVRHHALGLAWRRDVHRDAALARRCLSGWSRTAHADIVRRVAILRTVARWLERSMTKAFYAWRDGARRGRAVQVDPGLTPS